MSPKVEGYISLGKKYWGHAQELLAKEDWTQASEKLWGAAAESVKAVAEQKGWEHDGHGLLFKQISRLAKETGDTELQRFFSAAHTLHINFYENFLAPEAIQDYARAVADLRDRLARLLQE